ncbi:MAG: hypothetical protein ACI4GE_10235 [Lachnospiraceae bacterium]
MRLKYGKRLVVGTALSICLLNACGASENNGQAVANEDSVESIAGISSPDVTATPIAMQMSDSETPSGVKVEAKYQKYKVVMGVNVRADCSGDSEWVGSLFENDVVQGIGVCENGWIQILFEGKKSYVTGSCLEEVDNLEVTIPTGTEVTESVTPTPTVMPTPVVTETPQVSETPEAKVTPSVDVTDWAKYKSTKWESSSSTSCYVQIHSVAGNTVIFRFRVVDGALNGTGVAAEVGNCTGKIQDGIMNFNFTDDQGNVGIGCMEIVDDAHLRITTVITQPNPEATYKAEIMTELTEIE